MHPKGVDDDLKDTRSGTYAERLRRKEQAPWKRVLQVQAPYRWNIRRQSLGRTLDIGCGIGRNLEALPEGSVGVDHNEDAVRMARSRGLTAFTVDEWEAIRDGFGGAFDGLLVAHVLEHMSPASALELLKQYLPFLRCGGRAFLICPQERGFASDPTHVQFTTGEDLRAIAEGVGLFPNEPFSFPFPRWAGQVFTHNESCLLATKPRNT